MVLYVDPLLGVGAVVGVPRRLPRLGALVAFLLVGVVFDGEDVQRDIGETFLSRRPQDAAPLLQALASDTTWSMSMSPGAWYVLPV